MANYFLNDDGSITKKKKKKNGSNYLLQDDGTITLNPSETEDIAPIKTSNKKENKKRTWFNTAAFDDGYDVGDVTKTLIGTTKDVTDDFFTGAARIGEGVVDLGAYAVGAGAKAFGNDKLANNTKKFISRNLVDEHKIGEKIAATNPAGMTYNLFNALLNKGKTEENSLLGEKSDSLVQSGGQLAGTMALQSVGVPWWLTTGTTSFGSATEEAFNNDAGYGEAGAYGLISAGAEVLTEKLSGGISFGGKTLDAGLKKFLSEKITNKTLQTLTKFGIDAVGEGGEEVLTEVLQNIGKKLTYEDEKTWGELLTSEEAMDGYLEAFIGGAVMGGGFNVGRVSNSLKTGRDYDTGLTQNEQLVINKEVENRVAELQNSGETVTNKQKAKIEEQVTEDFKKGLISTNSTEKTLERETLNQQPINTEQSVQDIDNQIMALEEQLSQTENDAEYERISNEIRVLEERANQLEQAPVKQNTKQNDKKTAITQQIQALESQLNPKLDATQQQAVLSQISSLQQELNNTQQENASNTELNTENVQKTQEKTENIQPKTNKITTEDNKAVKFYRYQPNAKEISDDFDFNQSKVSHHEGFGITFTNDTRYVEGKDTNDVIESELDMGKGMLTNTDTQLPADQIQALNAVWDKYMPDSFPMLNQNATEADAITQINKAAEMIANNEDNATGKKAWDEFYNAISKDGFYKTESDGSITASVVSTKQIDSLQNENGSKDSVSTKINAENVQNDIAPIKQELADLTNELKDTIKNTKKEIKSLKTQLNDVISDLKENPAPISPKLAEAEVEGNLQSYVDNDSLAPTVKEDTTPDYEYENDNKGTKSTTEDPFNDRDYSEVGKRNVKAYQYEHPEVKSYFQPEAVIMLGELESSVKGERFIVGDISQTGNGNYEYSGTTRFTTDSIAQLLDGVDGKNKLTYEDIRKGLEAIIKDEGAENNAASKRIEFMLNDRLMNGYTTIDGYEVPANQGYMSVIEGIKAGEDFSNVPLEENPNYYGNEASNTEFTEENIPIRRNIDWNSIEDTSRSSQQNLNLNNLGETLLPSKADFNNVEDTSKGKQVTYNEETQQFEEEDLVKKTKRELRQELLGTEAQKEFITSALDNAKNRSMALMNNTDTIRNTELVFGRDAANVINEKIFQKEIDNEADSIKWQNEQRDAIKALGIKARSKESAAVQKYGEKQWVNDAGEVVAYGDAELASEFPDVATQDKIKNAAKEIRKKYDDYIDRANEVLTKLGFDPIKKRKDYMRHFQELTDVFSRHGIPFNAQNMAEHTLPTDINGLTEFWSPQKNYFANMQARKGMKTTYDAITGIDGYISGISNLIFHTEDIQRGRAFEELIRETYGEDKGWDNLENLPEELQQARSEKIQDNHLSNYAAWVHEWTNNVAGKKNKIDRSVEAMFGRKAFAFLDQTRKQVGSNMIGFNLSSSLTNLIAPVQAAAKTNKLALVKGTADTIKNIFVKDNFMDNNKFLTSRMGTDMISKNAWQKMQDAGFVFMKGMDWFSSNQIVRSKYYELRAKGMSEQQAHSEAGKFAARILGDRTKGANAQLYNSKLVGLVTQFQLEVNNQLYSQFYDTYHESKEAAKGNALKMAAGMTFTLGQLFAFTHLFGKTFEAIAGYNPTFDVIGMLATALGWDDEDDEKTTSERLKAAADQLVDALPYVNILTGGGRIPVASGIPNLVGVATGGKDQYGNELTLEDELKKLLYLIPPTGGNQVKKTTQGLSMFDEDLPVTGSYTDSGNLRFPVEDTIQNRIQASLFGQYANKNAGYYFDNDLAPLKEKQIEEFIEMDIPYKEYREYRKELSDINKTKADKDEKGKAISGTAAGKKAYQIMNGDYSKKEKERLLEGLSSETYRITTSDLNKLNNNEELYKYYFGLTTKGKSDFINAIKNYGFDAKTLYEVTTIIKNIENNYSKLNNNGANLSQQKKQTIKDTINQYTTTKAQYDYLYHKIYKK